MKKFIIGTPNTVEAFALHEANPGSPGAQEVSITVSHSGLGMVDALQVSGAMGDTTGHTPGLEVEGTITEVGAEVTTVKVGDRVAAICFGGGLSSQVITPQNMVVPIDDRFPEGLGAVCLVNSLTAWGALTATQATGRFETVIVHAGTGGLGSQFGQIARLNGATEVHAVVGNGRKERIARDLGYDRVWRRQDLPAIPDAMFDVAVDPVGGAATLSSWRSLRSGGRVVKVGNGSDSASVPLDSLNFWFENKSVLGFNVGQWINDDQQRAREGIMWCAEQVGAGTLRVPYEIRTIDRIGAALTDLLAGATSGKLVIAW